MRVRAARKVNHTTSAHPALSPPRGLIYTGSGWAVQRVSESVTRARARAACGRPSLHASLGVMRRRGVRRILAGSPPTQRRGASARPPAAHSRVSSRSHAPMPLYHPQTPPAKLLCVSLLPRSKSCARTVSRARYVAIFRTLRPPRVVFVIGCVSCNKFSHCRQNKL